MCRQRLVKVVVLELGSVYVLILFVQHLEDGTDVTVSGLRNSALELIQRRFIFVTGLKEKLCIFFYYIHEFLTWLMIHNCW